MRKYINYLMMVAVMMATVACTQPANKKSCEVLYNGIVLPEVWPPKYPVPLERKEMPLPYIDNKPCPIIINVGRQLFVDDFLIEQTDLKRVNHHTHLYEGNPILPNNLYSDGVWYDETDSKFKAWTKKHNPAGGNVDYCEYYESEDGYHWHAANQNVFPGTNVVKALHGDSHNIWINKQEKDPAKRFVSTCTVSHFDGDGFTMQYSADGIHWGKPVVHSGRIQDRSTVIYNAFRKKWVMSLRVCALDPPSRSRAYIEEDNLEDAIAHTGWIQDELDTVIKYHTENYVMQDEHAVFWFTADDKDLRHPNPEYAASYDPAIYNFDANAYESVMVGMYAMSRGPENNICGRDGIWKLNVVGLGYSRDGFHFYRPDHEEFIACANDDPEAWNGANMQAAGGNMLIVGDSLFFYTGALPKHPVRHGCSGLATIRRDGFVSMDAGDAEGTLVTSPVSFDGKYFFVNAIAKNLAVEVLDKDGCVIKGYSKDECVAMKDGDSTKFRITWNGKKDLGKLCGKHIRFKFYLTDGSLYAFWLSPWKTGESRGMTGGGGPGLHPSGVDLPVK